MHKIFHAKDVVLSEIFFDDGIGREGNALLVNFSVSALVDQFADGLEIGLADKNEVASHQTWKRSVPVCNVRLNETKHLLSSLCYFDKHTIVYLKETKELQDFTGFRRDFIDTARVRDILVQHRLYSPSNANNEIDLGLSRNVKVACSPSDSLQTNLFLLL